MAIFNSYVSLPLVHLGAGQNLLLSILMGWTSIYQLFWGDRKKGVISIDVLSIVIPNNIK